jgi:methionine-rich copper-binding protein CopC
MTVSSRRALQGLAGLALAAGLVVVGAQAASAHDALIGSTPGDGDRVSSVSEVTQTFSENLIDAGEGNFAEVTGPDGRHYENGCSQLAGPTITTPVALGGAGTYRVAWRAVSSDGHPIADEYTFEYAPAADAVAAEGTSEAACAEAASDAGAGDGTGEAADSDADAATETGDATESPTDTAPAPAAAGVDGLALGLGIGGVGVVVVAIVVVLILRRPRRE